MTELERLQKEINGKVIWWRSNEKGKLLHAICLYPPNGSQVSIKPYGLTAEEIQSVIYFDSIEEINEPSYCLTAISTDRIDSLEYLKELAEVPENCVYDPFKGETGSAPLCPYGG